MNATQARSAVERNGIDGLRKLERDLRDHFYDENYLLFPRASR